MKDGGAMKAEVTWGDHIASHESYAKNVHRKLCNNGFTGTQLEYVGGHAGHNVYNLFFRCNAFAIAINFYHVVLKTLESEYGVRVHPTFKLNGYDLSKVFRDLNI